jgi:ubiquinone/menaquinone biosynthesis C-methylase UbiE
MDTKQAVKTAFDQSAQKFDEIGPGYFKYYGQLLADAAEVHPGDHVLDIACGRGAVTFPVAEKLGGRGLVTGIDISAGMIDASRKLPNDKKIRDIAFRVMDAENLDFPDNSFDIITSGFGLFFLSDIKKGFDEVKRVLKPNGKLLFTSWEKPYHKEIVIEIVAKVLGRDVSDYVQGSSIISPESFRSEAGLHLVLEQAGLEKISITGEPFLCKYSSEDEWYDARMHSANRIFFENVPAELQPQLQRALYDVLSRYRTDEGIAIPISAFITKAKLPIR